MKTLVLAAALVVAGVSAASSLPVGEQFCEKHFSMKREDVKGGRVLGLLIIPKDKSKTFDAMITGVGGDKWTTCTCFVETGCDCCQVNEAQYCAYTERLAKTSNNRIRAGCAWERG